LEIYLLTEGWLTGVASLLPQVLQADCGAAVGYATTCHDGGDSDSHGQRRWVGGQPAAGHGRAECRRETVGE
jgi:hypothetical protein